MAESILPSRLCVVQVQSKQR